MSISDRHGRRRSRAHLRRFAPFFAAACGLFLLADAGAAFAQAESDTYAKERDPNWRGEVTGAGNLRQCSGITQEDRLLFLKAVYDNLDPDNYPSAEIRVMPTKELMALEEKRMRAAGFNSDRFWSQESLRAAANLKSRIVSYGHCRDSDVIVVEYKKSADKQTSDENVFKLYAEKNAAPRKVDSPPAQPPVSRAGTGGTTGQPSTGRPSRATICQRNPQAYQCLNGKPSDQVRSTPDDDGRVARAAPPLPAYLVSARTPAEAAQRAVNVYLSRYRAFRTAWEKAYQDHTKALDGCGTDLRCRQKIDAEAERRRAVLITENADASRRLASDVDALGARFGLSQRGRQRILEKAWGLAAAGQG